MIFAEGKSSLKIITYSDLHLEFGIKFQLSKNSDADLMILSGDIITSNTCDYLLDFLKGWDKPVLYVMGNHEYYNPYSNISEIN